MGCWVELVAQRVSTKLPVNSGLNKLHVASCDEIITKNTQTEILKKNGITMCITPYSGPIGTSISIVLFGMPTNFENPFASIGFQDSTGAPGADTITIDTRTLKTGEYYHTNYTIPDSVLVSAYSSAQNPSKKVPTNPGKGIIRLNYLDPKIQNPPVGESTEELDVPFDITP